MANRSAAHPWGTCGRCGRDLGNEANDLQHSDLGLVCRACYVRLNIEVMKLPTFRPGVRGQMGRWFWIERGPGRTPIRHGPFKSKEVAERVAASTWRWGRLGTGQWRRHLFADGGTLVPICGSAIFSYTAEDGSGERLADCRRCRRRAR